MHEGEILVALHKVNVNHNRNHFDQVNRTFTLVFLIICIICMNPITFEITMQRKP